jgi:hypothetical protein
MQSTANRQAVAARAVRLTAGARHSRSGAVLVRPSLIRVLFADPAVATEALLNQLRHLSKRWPVRMAVMTLYFPRFDKFRVKPTNRQHIAAPSRARWSRAAP